SSGFAADQHVVSPQQLAGTVSGHAAQQDADRTAIREALARPEVRDAAKSLNIDIDRIAATTATLSGADLPKAPDRARQVNEPLGGWSGVVMTTTIIIILLLVILLVVALR